MLVAAVAACSLLALGARAEPLVIEPFDPAGYNFTSPSGARLWSINNEGYNGKATSGNTKVFAPNGALLYEFPIFSGRRDIYLSPDGTVVVYDGNMYFGTEYMRATLYQEEDPTVTAVFLNGESWRNVTYEEDVGGHYLHEEEQWGWARRPFTCEVEWEQRVLSYDVVEFDLPLRLRGRRAQAEAARHFELTLPGLWDILLADIDEDATPLEIEPFDAGGYSHEAPSGARLWSTNDEGYDGKATTGTTKVFAPNGALVYEVPVFSGRRDIHLSPDATIIVLDGNVYFGTEYMKSTTYHGLDPVVTQVYFRGQSWKNVTYEGDLGGLPLAEDVPFGWAHRPFAVHVDWDQHMLVYEVGEVDLGVVTTRRIEISFPGLWDVSGDDTVGDDDDDASAITDDDDDYDPPSGSLPSSQPAISSDDDDYDPPSLDTPSLSPSQTAISDDDDDYDPPSLSPSQPAISNDDDDDYDPPSLDPPSLSPSLPAISDDDDDDYDPPSTDPPSLSPSLPAILDDDDDYVPTPP